MSRAAQPIGRRALVSKQHRRWPHKHAPGASDTQHVCTHATQCIALGLNTHHTTAPCPARACAAGPAGPPWSAGAPARRPHPGCCSARRSGTPVAVRARGGVVCRRRRGRAGAAGACCQGRLHPRLPEAPPPSSTLTTTHNHTLTRSHLDEHAARGGQQRAAQAEGLGAAQVWPQLADVVAHNLRHRAHRHTCGVRHPCWRPQTVLEGPWARYLAAGQLHGCSACRRTDTPLHTPDTHTHGRTQRSPTPLPPTFGSSSASSTTTSPARRTDTALAPYCAS
jgi:hypothetical protein